PRHGADETPTARQPDIEVDDLAREGLTRAADAGDVPDDPRQALDVCDDLRELLPAEGVGWQLAAPQLGVADRLDVPAGEDCLQHPVPDRPRGQAVQLDGDAFTADLRHLRQNHAEPSAQICPRRVVEEAHQVHEI